MKKYLLRITHHRRSALALLLAVVVISIILVSGDSARAEVTGFRGRKWGMDISELKADDIEQYDHDHWWAQRVISRIIRYEAYPVNANFKQQGLFFITASVRDEVSRSLYTIIEIAGDSTKIGDIHITQPTYLFVDNKLQGVIFQVSGKDKSEDQLENELSLLKAAFQEQYGEDWNIGEICVTIDKCRSKEGNSFLEVRYFGYENNALKDTIYKAIKADDDKKLEIQKKKEQAILEEGKNMRKDL